MRLLNPIGTLLVSASFALGATPLFAQTPDFESVQIETIPLRDGIYMLVGEGGNIGVSAGEDGVFLIDDQFAPLTEKIVAAIRTISSEPVRFLINTHWHFDHTGGNENFGKAGVVIVAHDNVRDRMSTEQIIEVIGRTFPPSPTAALPIITFNDTMTFHLNGETIHAFHVDSAHTDGDAIVHFKEANIIHTGDTYFNGFYPFIDVESGGSIEGMIAAIEGLSLLIDDETHIIPGHGPLSNQAELMVYLEMLKTVRDRVKVAIDKGMSSEDFIASEPMADFPSTWGQGFLSTEQFLQIVYADLAR
ncbi:MBL fold metallo-hydrolase [Lusitaniella coriacea LEGE 07157]|uniref:MBL fold metallo-hydrolase n=1 Tax=Lusitaniella coriacea LEGE 07157 TaxID=945747 RepID=A0A8J7AML0_9CYAN|nr:MBL fold metallo-hydrolase [Lusitaniella coriacea]MBE9114633.1 MBL fold metallo-hydrolase [Lusitaniella coriacea LEGE 07157]